MIRLYFDVLIILISTWKPGSKFEVEDGAIVYVRNGGKLLIEDGADIIINGTRKVYIESTGSIIYDGGDIILTDNNSILEIAGVLDIKDNRTFTFTRDGFIRFNLPIPSTFPSNYTNITATPTSSIILEGSSKNDKVAEIMNGSWVSPPDAMQLFKIKKGTVLMGENSFINIGAQQVELNNILVSKLGGIQAYVHRGIYINGQANHYITGVEIENGKIGLTARNFYNQGADFRISNSNFHDNEIGLKIWGKGASLYNVSAKENEVGWLSLNMDRPVRAKYSLYNDNSNGIIYSGFGSGGLYLDECAIDRNFGDGISYGGSSMLTARCGSVKENYEAGFQMGKFSFLNLSNTGFFPNLVAGNVQITDNRYAMEFLPYSITALLETGNNKFSFDNVQGSPVPLFAKGVMDNGCNTTLYAINNQWYHSSPTSQPAASDYSLNLDVNSCFPAYSIYIHDPQPVSYRSCPLNPYEPDPVLMREGSPLAYCEDCPLILSDYFNDTTDFRDAVLYALNQTTYADSINGDDAFAVDLFHAIIFKAAEFYDHEQVQWLSDFSYYYLKQSLGSGINSGSISESMSNTHFGKVNEVQNLLIELAIIYDQPLKQFIYRTDNALLYNLANERSTALHLLTEAESCLELDEELQDYLDEWRAYINAVELVVTNQNHIMEFETIYEESYNDGLRLNAGLGVAKRDTVLISSNSFPITGNTTANDNSGNYYSVSSIVKDSLTDFLIVKYDGSLNVLWTDTIGGWSRGADTARTVTVDAWDNVYINGQVWNGSNYDVMTVKYDSVGEKHWIAMYNSPEKWNDIPYGINVDTSGFVYVALQSTSDSGSYHSKITYSQCNCPTGISLRNNSQPEDNIIYNYLDLNLDIYPNPADKQLTIAYSDPEKQIYLKMVNALGQEIYRNTFNSKLNIDVSSFPKGVYLLHLEEKTGGMKTVKKILLQ